MTDTERRSADALLVQLTDTHLCAQPGTRLRGIDPERTLAAVVALATPWLQRADHVVLTGDLTHDGSVAGARRLGALLEPFGAPISHLPGNHDDPATLCAALGGQPEAWPRCVRIQGWDLILLNSHVPGQEGGWLGAPQRDQLAAWLDDAPQRPTLVALHHHPVPVGSAWMDAMVLADGDALMELLRPRPWVRGVLFGHVHQRFEAREGQLSVLGSPSTCMQFEPRSTTSHSDRRLPGFRWLKLRADGTLESGVERIAAWPDATAPQR